MKGFTAMMRILIALTSLALVLMLVLSILPIATGQFNVGDGEPLEMSASGTDIKIDGSVKITSNLKEDVKDVNIYVYAESDTGMKLEILNETKTIAAGETISYPIHVQIPIPEAMVFLVAENNGGTGITMPLKIGVGGVYFHDMLGFKFSMDYDLSLSETASVSIKAPTVNAENKITGIEAEVAGIVTEDVLDGFIPDGSDISAKISVPGADDFNMSVTRTGDKLSVNIGTGTDKDMESVIDAIVSQATEKGETVSIDVNGETIELDQDQIDRISSIMKEYIGLVGGLPEAVA